MMELHSPAVLDLRLTNVERAVERVTTAVESIDKSLQALTNLETKHEQTRESLGRAFGDIDRHDVRIRVLEADSAQIAGRVMSYKNDCNTSCVDHETRIRAVEGTMPTIKLASGWMIVVVVGVAAIVGTSIVNAIIK